MKLTKSKLKEIIREELLKEATPDADLYKKLTKISDDIVKLSKSYDNKADVKTALYTFMAILHRKLMPWDMKKY